MGLYVPVSKLSRSIRGSRTSINKVTRGHKRPPDVVIGVLRTPGKKPQVVERDFLLTQTNHGRVGRSGGLSEKLTTKSRVKSVVFGRFLENLEDRCSGHEGQGSDLRLDSLPPDVPSSRLDPCSKETTTEVEVGVLLKGDKGNNDRPWV